MSLDANERSRRTIAGINPTMKRQFELEIKALQNAIRGEDRLEQLLIAKEKKGEGQQLHTRLRVNNC